MIQIHIFCMQLIICLNLHYFYFDRMHLLCFFLHSQYLVSAILPQQFINCMQSLVFHLKCYHDC